MNVHLFYLTLLFYAVATIGYLAYLAWVKKPLWMTSRVVLIIGFLCHTASIVARYVEAGYTPVTNRFESLIFFSWLLVAVYLAVQIRHTLPVLGAFVTPLALGLLLMASFRAKEILPLDGLLDSHWLPAHVWFAFLGDALLGVSACFAAMYLIQEEILKKKKIGPLYYRLPSLEVLDRLSYRCISDRVSPFDGRDPDRVHLAENDSGRIPRLAGREADRELADLVPLCRPASREAHRRLERPPDRLDERYRVPGDPRHLLAALAFSEVAALNIVKGLGRIMEILCIGLNHETAPVAVRERLALTGRLPAGDLAVVERATRLSRKRWFCRPATVSSSIWSRNRGPARSTRSSASTSQTGSASMKTTGAGFTTSTGITRRLPTCFASPREWTRW